MDRDPEQKFRNWLVKRAKVYDINLFIIYRIYEHFSQLNSSCSVCNSQYFGSSTDRLAGVNLNITLVRQAVLA
jgi:hypothetical protein